MHAASSAHAPLDATHRTAQTSFSATDHAHANLANYRLIDQVILNGKSTSVDSLRQAAGDIGRQILQQIADADGGDHHRHPGAVRRGL